MKILRDFSMDRLVRRAIKANWENYHYCLALSPSVELSIGRYLTWFITHMPDHFMNLVVCTQLPSKGVDELVEKALTFSIIEYRESDLAGTGRCTGSRNKEMSALPRINLS
jgi:hypothetical protein